MKLRFEVDLDYTDIDNTTVSEIFTDVAQNLLLANEIFSPINQNFMLELVHSETKRVSARFEILDTPFNDVERDGVVTSVSKFGAVNETYAKKGR